MLAPQLKQWESEGRYGRAAGSDLATAARLPRVLVLLPQGARGAR